MRRFAPFLALLLVTACGAPRTSEQSPGMPKSSKIVVYQMMTRLFGNREVTNKPYGTLEENGVGKFSDITTAALAELRDLGATHIWYTGVIEHAVLTDYTRFAIPLDDADVVKGRAGSPYAIKDYYDVNPDLAVDVPNRMNEFAALIERTHAEGLRVILDFVPNHVARAYYSDAKPDDVTDLGDSDDRQVRFSPSNNFYYLPGESFVVPAGYDPLGPNNSFPTKDGKFEEIPAKATGNDQFTASPGINEWFETVKLNYGVDIQDGRKTYFDPVPDTWNKMKDILIFWTGRGVDGFRCDMAEMVPVEFWNWCIPQIKKVNPDVIFIAEIYNPAAYRDYISKGGFDFLYDKVQLYDTLRKIIAGHGSTGDILQIQKSLEGINDHMVHFLENHDEQRIASRFFAGDPHKALPGMVVSSTIDKGPIMIYFGQEVGEPGLGSEGFQGDDGRTTIFDYWGVPEHQKWMNGGAFDGGLLDESQKNLRDAYRRILNLAKNSKAIAEGRYTDLTEFNIERNNFNGDVSVFVRWNDDDVVMVVAGFNADPVDIRIEIAEDVAKQLGLLQGELLGVDLLESGKEVSFKEMTAALTLAPYGYYIFRIQK